MSKSILTFALSPLALALASCGYAATGDSSGETASTPAPATLSDEPFSIEHINTYEEPWAATFVPGTDVIVVTEKEGKVVGFDNANGKAIFFTGVPEVDYGGQGGMGDVAFLPSEAGEPLSGRTIFLTYVEAGDGDTRGAALGKGTLLCEEHQTCDIQNWQVIWRQSPKTSGRAHYSHRIAFSPDGEHIFVSSGERRQRPLIQDTSNNISAVVRLNLDGSAASGNPFSDAAGAGPEIWSYGHRNILGMDFDLDGQLWAVEHGPKGGDELNLVKAGRNFGWPVRSNGVEYSGGDIPDHTPDDGFTKPVITWTPVIAPGDMTVVQGGMFSDWRGDLLIAGLSSNALVHVTIDGENASEAARYSFENRIRSVVEGPQGALWVLEDGEEGRLLKLTPASS